MALSLATSTPGSHSLARADVARLRLSLPFELDDGALQALQALRPGAGYEMVRGGASDDAELIQLVIFDLTRMLDEVSSFSPGKQLVADGWVPIAGCGNRGLCLYLIQLQDGLAARLHRYTGPQSEAPELEDLQLTLLDLLQCGTPKSGLRLRRRIPRRQALPALPKARARSKPTRRPLSQKERRLLARNLSLF